MPLLEFIVNSPFEADSSEDSSPLSDMSLIFKVILGSDNLHLKINVTAYNDRILMSGVACLGKSKHMVSYRRYNEHSYAKPERHPLKISMKCVKLAQ